MSGLQKLIEAVEDGDRVAVDTHAKALASAARDLGRMWPAFDVIKAHAGSLDAAKALHEALLPGWEWGRTEGNIYVKDPRRGSKSTKWGGPNEVASRSWLLAILRAHAAQQELSP